MKNGEIIVEVKADMDEFNAAIKEAIKAVKELKRELNPKWWQFWIWFRPIHFHINETKNFTRNINT